MPMPCLMIALLTCSWVLWQTVLVGNREMHTPIMGYETRDECVSAGIQSWKPSKTKQEHADGMLRDKEGRAYSYTCLPDTVKP
jgi:hypothetical protein